MPKSGLTSIDSTAVEANVKIKTLKRCLSLSVCSNDTNEIAILGDLKKFNEQHKFHHLPKFDPIL
jgi:hypothetical protein